MDWNPDQYEKFKQERDQAFWDLLALVRVKAGMRVADLGCGPGSLTRALHEKLAARETVGVDSSEAMLERARPLGGGGLRFERGDIASFGGTWDLIFSNAALHWLPRHEELFARLAGALLPGGQLAVQVPANFDQPSHTVAEAVAAELGAPAYTPPVLLPEQYAAHLHRLGFAEQHVRLQVYPHRLSAREDVIEWVRGTTLVACQARLGEEKWPVFLERYRDRLLARLPDEKPFFFPFKRILIWGTRSTPSSR